MTTDWYHLFLLAVLVLWATATSADRNALRVILGASLSSWLIADCITVNWDGAWKLVVPGVVETATIAALVHWAPGRSGWMQVGCLSVAWIAHVTCFIDLQLGTDFVYSKYEAVLASVSAGQIISFHDTYLHHLRRLGQWCGVLAVRGTGVPSVVLHHSGSESLQPLPPCKTPN